MTSEPAGEREAKIRVFLSYSRQDLDFAEAVQARLTASGIEAWVDHASLLAGDRWTQQIDEAIRSADALVLLQTASSAASQYVLYEWAFAIGGGVPIIPVRREVVEENARLRELQWLDFSGSARPWQQLIELIVLRAGERGRVARDVAMEQRWAEAEAAVISKNRDAALDAVHWLVGIKDSRSDALLLRAFEHWGFLELMAALAERRLVAAVPGLVRLCGARMQPTQRQARDALVAIADPGTIDLIDAALKGDLENGDAHATWVSVLAGWSKSHRVVDLLIAYMQRLRLLPPTSNPWGSEMPGAGLREAAFALGEQGDPRGVPCLLSFLRHESRHVAIGAIEALGKLGAIEAIGPLIECLQSDQDDVVQATLEALARIGDDRSLTTLVQVATNTAPDDEFRRLSAKRTAVLGLVRAGPAGAAQLQRVFEHEDREGRAAAVEAIRSQKGPAELVPALVPLLADREPVEYERDSSYQVCAGSMTDLVAQALMAIGSEAALAALRQHHDGQAST